MASSITPFGHTCQGALELLINGRSNQSKVLRLYSSCPVFKDSRPRLPASAGILHTRLRIRYASTLIYGYSKSEGFNWHNKRRRY